LIENFLQNLQGPVASCKKVSESQYVASYKKLSDIFLEGIRTYGEVGYPGEWKLYHQGGATGYEARDYIATSKINEVVQPN